MKRMVLRLLVLVSVITTTFSVVSLRANSKQFSPPEVAHESFHSGPVASSQTVKNEIADEEYAVYSALINESGRAGNATRLLVIKEKPSPWVSSVDEVQPDFYDELKKSSPALSAETIDNLRAKNKEDLKFTRSFKANRQYELIAEEELKSFFSKGVDGWKSFFEKYPKSGGFVTFSRVGFNRKKTQALVYQGYNCGGLCGGGTYYLLTKKAGVWTIKGPIGPSWVS